MSDITANLVIGMPAQLFTLARSFKANANGKIYIGQPDTDPTNPANQIQVYVENEDGSHIPVPQPIIINAGGFPVLNGQIKKFVTVQNYSMAVYDAYNSQQFYFENVAKYDPDQLRQQLEDLDSPEKYPELYIPGWRDEGSVKGWGAKGDYVTDDTTAINAAVAAAGEGGIVYFPRGVYRYVGSLILPPGVKLIGEGSPTMQIAPIESDDKRYMRPGYKHLIPGSSILFSGSATRSKSTARSDRFASFTYALSTSLDYPNQITGLGIIQDMDVYDAAGALTSPSTDNRSNYNCGLLINDATHCSFSDVCVFGYWPVAGTAIVGQASVSNPDYNYFDRFSTTGDIGLAIVGSQNSGTGAEGISGNTFSQCRIHDRTHHDRVGSSVADLGTNAIYVDGVTQVNTNIAGVKFIGCCIRTTVEVPVKLDHCQDVAFIGCTTEMVTNAKYAPAATKHITGTANTGRVVLSGNRMLSSFENIEILAATIKGPLLVDDDSAGVQFFAKDGAGICHGVTDEISGDPFIQFTTDFTNVTRGFNLRYNKATQSLSVNYDNANSLKFNSDGTIEAPNGIKQKLSAGGRVSRTIAAGAITLPTNSSYISVESEGAAATDDLDTINGGVEGDIIILTSFTSAHDITVKDGTNLRLNGDFVLTTSEDTITLMKSISGFWLEISRSDNSL